MVYNSSAKYNKKYKKRYKKQFVKIIEIFGEKVRRQQYGCENYENLSQHEKQILIKYRKNINKRY